MRILFWLLPDKSFLGGVDIHSKVRFREIIKEKYLVLNFFVGLNVTRKSRATYVNNTE